MTPIQSRLSPALLSHFGDNYMDFIDLYRARVISYAVACDWCRQIGSYIQAIYYSESKAA